MQQPLFACRARTQVIPVSGLIYIYAGPAPADTPALVFA